MAFVCKAGATAIISYPTSPIQHLYICLLNPSGTPAKTIWINVTSKRANSDPTLVLEPGDHPFILHDSVLSYQYCMEVEVSKLTTLEKEGFLKANVDLDLRVLEAIQNAVVNSKSTPKGIVIQLNELIAKSSPLLMT